MCAEKQPRDMSGAEEQAHLQLTGDNTIVTPAVFSLHGSHTQMMIILYILSFFSLVCKV